MDKIFITGLREECIVGVWEWERQVKQAVVLDIEMAVDIRKAAASERLEDTIDYKKVSKRLQSFIGASQFQLVETLTERVAEIIIKEFQVSWVKVKLNKQGALRGSKDVGVVIERTTADYT